LAAHFAHHRAGRFATASMLNAVKMNGSNPPMNSPMIISGLAARNEEIVGQKFARTGEMRAQFFDIRSEQNQPPSPRAIA